MPDPFRHYEGVPVLDLPADPPAPQASALGILHGQAAQANALDGPAFLSQFLYHSAAISATKRVPSSGYQYALRVNPSSGNLHPTEFHFLSQGLRGWPDGLYHYRPSSHMAEQRAEGIVPSGLPGGTLNFVLTSIAWREEWKYRDRAYRYCLHDIGHAWQALVLAARAMGCESFATALFADDELTQALRLSGDEWPMLAVSIRGPAPGEMRAEAGCTWHGGEPNILSTNQIEYPRIEAMHQATKVKMNGTGESADHAAISNGIALPAPALSSKGYGEVARTRRSALDFRGGMESISFGDLSALLHAASQPLAGDFCDRRFVQLYLYVHRVEGLAPGMYRYWPETGQLELMRSGDQQVMAAGLSLGQQLAGNACVAFSMIADLERATRLHGDRGYRCAYFEAGAIGQRLYLAAESLGVRATGIGAFYDDEVHNYLGLTSQMGQVVYHFAIGHPVHDPRLDAHG